MPSLLAQVSFETFYTNKRVKKRENTCEELCSSENDHKHRVLRD